ncbi:hypothetical protein VitviT2T_000695 [Vitis vinifera]|uniref:1,4-dihydroxy-2-naphthoyl-CoA synthase, peroxisomal n=1 Tax=Vitis vinifera TaxID=29760 RepID=A0ABY9BER1_VITVI|nr:hypothetical protein VitviT2T_000695 [Vitis vinifera]
MAQIANKDLNANARRRLASVAHHLTPLHSTTPNCSSLGFHTTSAPDSYRRVHGEVPTHDVTWNPACDESGKAFTDIIYEKAVGEAIAKITINRPERRNAFRPNTVKELIRAFNDARDDSSVGVIIFTGKGTKAFCSGGDQAFRGRDGYADHDDFGRLNVLDLQMQIRRLPKPVIAMVYSSCSYSAFLFLHLIHLFFTIYFYSVSKPGSRLCRWRGTCVAHGL